uniref:ATP synthase subunit gamma n=1 Tax=Pavlova pinguis TaxID=119481 RepID=D7UT02_9EUKA|nr:ATP synthase gamma chain [Pavlova pinguis]
MFRSFALALLVASASAFNMAPGMGHMPVAARPVSQGNAVVMGDNIRELRTRIASIKNTQKITSAMKLVAAAKVRRAQDAVIRSRPFSENLEKVLGGLIERLKNEPLDFPLLQERETNSVLLVVVSGERGLCGGYNAQVIKKTQARLDELKEQGVSVKLLCVGRKANVWFARRGLDIVKFEPCPQTPTSEFASELSDEILNYFLSEEVDRVELLYTSFVSMISSVPSVRTLVPLSPQGLETAGDEIFKLTTKDGKFGVERETVPRAEPEQFQADMIFEQEPAQLLNAILPLYINGQILRTVQVSARWPLPPAPRRARWHRGPRRGEVRHSLTTPLAAS